MMDLAHADKVARCAGLRAKHMLDFATLSLQFTDAELDHIRPTVMASVGSSGEDGTLALLSTMAKLRGMKMAVVFTDNEGQTKTISDDVNASLPIPIDVFV